MERESLLATLIVLLGGAALQIFAFWFGGITRQSAPRERRGERRGERQGERQGDPERVHWLILWSPLAPALTVAAWLCGWALSQPDPVPHHVGMLLILAALPFWIIGARAVARALSSLCYSSRGFGIATVGVLRPHVVIAPEVVELLDAAALRAAVAHEHSHVRHWDPLRIWLAQFATDLQWPCRPAQRRFERWLASLEFARDDEARAHGVDGADLAAAVIACLRFQVRQCGAAAHLIGETQQLPRRIARLLRPLPSLRPDSSPPYLLLGTCLLVLWLAAILSGIAGGERVVALLLAVS